MSQKSLLLLIHNDLLKAEVSQELHTADENTYVENSY